jgi:NAD(P)-dependent dehydrogenase (short-subunit alcohol dehydrogenase family)
MGRLDGKVAIVSGAGSGIGEASAARLAAEGAEVVLADIRLDAVERNSEAIRRVGGLATAVQVDSGDERSVEALFEQVRRTYRGVDIVHNNAIGTPRTGALPAPPSHYLHDSAPEVFDALLHGTVTATMLGIKHSVPLMIERGGGSIINTASIAGMRGEVFMPAYGAGKAGVIQLTRAAAAMYGRQGIRCNAICPALILTPAGRSTFNEAEMALWRKHTVASRLGEADDVAHLVVYLASDESAFVTGQAIVVDGGFTMHEPMWADRLEISSMP